MNDNKQLSYQEVMLRFALQLTPAGKFGNISSSQVTIIMAEARQMADEFFATYSEGAGE